MTIQVRVADAESCLAAPVRYRRRLRRELVIAVRREWRFPFLRNDTGG